jgi:hypothetical protein
MGIQEIKLQQLTRSFLIMSENNEASLMKREDFQIQEHRPAVSGMVSVEQSRAIAETQAAMVVAKSHRRDEFDAYSRIMKACQRPSLASSAMYAYRRGGAMVEGPSIRLAEVLARARGNITYGLRELSRTEGESEIEAFSWDLETNTRVTRQFVVRHIRDTKGGAKKLTEERDVYELAANMGQRRVRACLLELIPGDIVEEAVNQCKKTLALGDGRPFEDRIRSMIVAFEELGVTKDMIEGFLSHKITAMVPAQLVKLTQIYKSIKDGVAPREEYFDINSGPGASDLNERFGKKKAERKPEQKQPETPTSPDILKIAAEIDEVKSKPTIEYVDIWCNKHFPRLQKAYGDKTADLIMAAAQERRNEISAAEKTSLDNDNPETVTCPESGQEIVRSDCEGTNCAEKCPLFVS